MKNILLLALMFCASSLNAQVNPSFEITASLPLSDGAGGFWNYGPIPGWTLSGEGGLWMPGAKYFPSVPDGKLIAWLNKGSISQDLGVPPGANTIYMLTVSIGRRTDLLANSYTISLNSGATVLCVASGNSSIIPPGTFQQESCTFTSDANPAAGNLSISIMSVGTQIDLDAVTLTKAPAKPFDYVLPGLGTVTFPMQAPPVCTPADGACSIVIQACLPDGVTCLNGLGTLSLVKTFSLPTPQVLTVPVAVATNP